MRNLQGVVSFVESAAAGSFTSAAARLELTPAAVSKNVIRLERQLQVRLFNRTARRLKLTPEGIAFLAKASQALRTLDEAVDDVTQASGAVAGRVRISTGVSFGRRYVLPLLPGLAQRHARLELELALDNRNVDLVDEGFDIGLRGGVVHESSLVARRVARLPVVLVASPAYLRRHGAPARPEALGEHQVLGVRSSPGHRSTWLFRRRSGRGVTAWEPSARVCASDPEVLIDLALAGAGIAQIGLHQVGSLLRAGRLRIVLHGRHDPGEREIILHYPHRQFLSVRVRLVVDALLEHLRTQPDLQLDPRTVPAEWLA